MMRSGVWLVVLVLCGCMRTPQPDQKQALSDWLWSQRAFPEGRVNSQVYHEEREKLLTERQNTLRSGPDWEFEGPTNIGGRITDIEVPTMFPDIIWIGAASGGAFKSGDRGQTWTPMMDMVGAPPVGDIALRPNNFNEVWVGTGETNGGSGSIAYEGFGVLRSMNGGRTWENMGLEESGSIGRIVFHPNDPATIYVAAMGYLFEENGQRGIFKTTDGGQTWEQILYLNDKTGGSDLIIDPVNPDILYASMWERIKYPDHKVYGGRNSGVYRSQDGGDTWTKMNLDVGKFEVGRIGIAMAPSQRMRLYALVTGVDGEYEGFFSTSNGGDSWTKHDLDMGYNYRNSGYWFCDLTVNPHDMNEVFACGLDMLRILGGGDEFEHVCDMHVDHHIIYAHPIIEGWGLVGNDGGLYSTSDNFYNCQKYRNLPITQFYTCTLDPIDEDVVYGGTQDNNPLIRRRGQNNWNYMLGGDGFVTLPDPRDNDIIYTEYQYGNIFRSEDGGREWYRVRDGLDDSRSNWNTPYLFDPFDPDVMYIGTRSVHRTDNNGFRWYPISGDLSNGPGRNLVYGTITSLDVSKIDNEKIIAGTDDGNVWITVDAGQTWDQVDAGLPERWVTRVVCDPHDSETYYVTFSGLKWHDYVPHIFRSEDGGLTWEDIGEDLPEVPVNDLIVDPENSRRYWCATDLGVFESLDAGETWWPLGTAMPVAIINDIDFRADTRRLLAGTYGRSMWSIDVPRISTGSDDGGEEVISWRRTEGGLFVSGPEGEYDLDVVAMSGQVVRTGKVRLANGLNQVWKTDGRHGALVFRLTDQNGRMETFTLVR